MRLLTFLLMVVRVLKAQAEPWGGRLAWRESLATLFSTPQPSTSASGRDGLQTLSQRKALTGYVRRHSERCLRNFG